MKRKRFEQIEEFMMKNRTSSVEELAEKFNISVTTVRRDLDFLEKEGILKKEYGGVRYIENNSTLIPYSERVDKNKDKKMYICKLAADLIQNDECIFIDTGTTTSYIVDFLENKNVTIVTNNLYVIEKCAYMTNIQLVILGGELNRDIRALVGSSATNLIKQFNIQKAFMASSGFTPESGFTNALAIESEMKISAIENSQEIFVLIDDTKWNKIALRTFLKFDNTVKIITNEEPTLYKDFFKNNIDNIIF